MAEPNRTDRDQRTPTHAPRADHAAVRDRRVLGQKVQSARPYLAAPLRRSERCAALLPHARGALAFGTTAPDVYVLGLEPGESDAVRQSAPGAAVEAGPAAVCRRPHVTVAR